MKQNNTLALILATIGGGGTEFVLTNNTWVTALCMAAVGAAVGWFTTQILNWCKARILNRKIKK
nr:hypothetical protein [uncultured Draconibacterium sp.]